MSVQLLNVYVIYLMLRPQYISIWIKNCNANVWKIKKTNCKHLNACACAMLRENKWGTRTRLLMVINMQRQYIVFCCSFWKRLF